MKTTIRLFSMTFAFLCVTISQQARAVCQEGCDTIYHNTFLGDDTLIANNTGTFNTAIGFFALENNTDGSNNTATGAFALAANTTSFWNTATGSSALNFNTTGDGNTANGGTALYFNTTGFFNTASGFGSLNDNTTGSENTASGVAALYNNTTGSNNTAIGQFALHSNTTGNFNIAIGSQAGVNHTTGRNNIAIFDRGVAGEANTIRIGKQGIQTTTFIAGISGATVPTGVAVIVDGNGHLGTTTSSARFKEAIKPMDKASEVILALKPVTFRYKHELDPTGIPQFGLVAEQVEKVNPDLVARDDQGKPYSVRYEAVNAMLLNEFLKEHRKVEEQQATIAQLKAADAKQEEKISVLTELVKAQAAQIQKVGAQLEVNKTASQIVLNNQ
jgi:Chaperone of endosialidase